MESHIQTEGLGKHRSSLPVSIPIHSQRNLHILLFWCRSRSTCVEAIAPTDQLVITDFCAVRLQEVELFLETKICDEGKNAWIAIATLVVAEFQGCTALLADINATHLFQSLGSFFRLQIGELGQLFDSLVADLQQFGEQVQAAVIDVAEVQIGRIDRVLCTRRADGQDGQKSQEERAANHARRLQIWRRALLCLVDASCRPSFARDHPFDRETRL